MRVPFRRVVGVDFEFTARDGSGDLPIPICGVFTELPSGRTIRLWTDELHARREAPFPTDKGTLWVRPPSFECGRIVL